ncbi:MAG: hypothetical protein ACREK5_07450 [Gemmatimonadota bacterium]
MSHRYIVGFLLLTGLLVLGTLGWRFYRYQATAPQREAWAGITDRLRTEKSTIDSLEAELAEGRRRLAAQRVRLDSLEGSLAAFEGRAMDGRLPRPQHQAYMSVIEAQNEAAAAHNEALVEVQSIYEVYAGLVRGHNAVIDSANCLRRVAAEEGIRLEDVELR